MSERRLDETIQLDCLVIEDAIGPIDVGGITLAKLTILTPMFDAA